MSNKNKVKGILAFLRNGAMYNKETTGDKFLDIVFIINIDKMQDNNYFRGYPFTEKEKKLRDEYTTFLSNNAIADVQADLVIQIYDIDSCIKFSWEFINNEEYYCGHVIMPYKKYKTKDGYRWLKTKDIQGKKAKDQIVNILLTHKQGEA